MEKRLENKRILFLSPAFFDYERLIREKCEELGAEVVYYDERAVQSAKDRAILKVCPGVFKKRARRYYEEILSRHKGERFDYIFVVKCDMIAKETIAAMREAYPEARLCLHLWDSVRNIPGVAEKLSLFDYATSFDRMDCQNYDTLHFRPLFYGDAFAARGEAPAAYRYDMSFCGTIHSDRLAVLRAMETLCRDRGMTYYGFHYLQSKFIYRYYKITNRSFKGARREDFSFEKKSHAEIAEIENASRIMIDIQHPGQTGLTMRTIEMLGMNKKLITTNEDIKAYDFYDPANICIIDRKDPRPDEAFLTAPYRRPDESVYRKYSLEQWVLDVLGEGK